MEKIILDLLKSDEQNNAIIEKAFINLFQSKSIELKDSESIYEFLTNVNKMENKDILNSLIPCFNDKDSINYLTAPEHIIIEILFIDKKLNISFGEHFTPIKNLTISDYISLYHSVKQLLN